MSTVDDGKIVIFHYTLRDDDGEVLDSSEGDDPMPYMHGRSNIVPGLESALAGKAVGFKGIVVVEPEDGYGLHSGEDPQGVPREHFPEDFPFEVGLPLMVENEAGEHMPVWISEVTDDAVYLDANHPLAGVTLHFEVEIVAIRDATAEEQIHGHPHGVDGTEGHHHDH